MLQMGKRETAFVLSLESLQMQEGKEERKARRKGKQGGKAACKVDGGRVDDGS